MTVSTPPPFLPGITAMSDSHNAPPDILEQDGTLLVRFHGRMDSLHTGIFSRDVLARIQSSGKAVVFDLEAVSFLSSAFLSLCISAAKDMQGGERLRLVNVGPDLKKVLKIAGLDEGLLSISSRDG